MVVSPKKTVTRRYAEESQSFAEKSREKQKFFNSLRLRTSALIFVFLRVPLCVLRDSLRNYSFKNSIARGPKSAAFLGAALWPPLS
jgi:hypothetical protein